MVMSGRCVPPWYGSFRITVSPGRHASMACSAASRLRGMAPRCTGMCAACATIPPCASNTAHEKSSRSLILGRIRRPPQRHAHFLGDARKPMPVQFQKNRVHPTNPFYEAILQVHLAGKSHPVTFRKYGKNADCARRPPRHATKAPRTQSHRTGPPRRAPRKHGHSATGPDRTGPP